MEPDSLGCADEPDGPVEPGVVRDRQPGQTQLDRSLDQVIGRRRPIQEREVGVAMEFGVRGLDHGSLRSNAVDWGLVSIEQTFYHFP